LASLFGKHSLLEQAALLDTALMLPKIQIIKTWWHDYHHGSLKTDKETSREQQYNQDVFMRVLGYTEKPAANHTFEPKASTSTGQLPDAIVGCLSTNSALSSVNAVVELKGAKVDLDRPQQGAGNLSPVQQAFKYRPQYRGCSFVIVSNFYEFRLYHDNQLDYERWTLDELVDPKNDYVAFKTWYTLLNAENLTSAAGPSRTENLLSDIRIEQEAIGNEFYKAYQEARLGLLRDIWTNNAIVRGDIDLGIEKAQKLIDRLVFTCFAEDRGLLPDDTLARVVSQTNTGFASLWANLQGLFHAIDKGNSRLNIPTGYNGGLFRQDAELDGLAITDEALLPLVKLGQYDFREQLSVTVLGHIFEQSISDLDDIRSKVAVAKSLDQVTLSKRKRDGIYYTPDYVVRAIVDATLGEYLRNLEQQILRDSGLKSDIKDKTYASREQDAYRQYQQALQSVSVVDPACGSGAFLVHVYDYLMSEHERVGAILGDLFSQEEHVRSVLRNNIFGVDLNAESVEITKLSLWLKSATKNEKLTSLDDNIKVGNSLVSDPAIAGRKAFDWHASFPRVMESGGFEVIVGNPPYGAKVSKPELAYLQMHINNTVLGPSLSDTYIVFYVFCMGTLLRSGGKLGFIAPNTWCLTESAAPFREYLLQGDFTVDAIVSHKEKVFEEATVDTNSVVVTKTRATTKTLVRTLTQRATETLHDNLILQSSLASRDFVNTEMVEEDYALVRRMEACSTPLSAVADVKNGVKPYEVGKGIPKQTKEILAEKPFTSVTKPDHTFVPLIGGSSFHRYQLRWEQDFWIKYGPHLAAPRDREIFDAREKLIFRQTGDSLIGTHISSGYIMRDNTHIVLPRADVETNLMFVLGVMNSLAANYYYWSINPEKGEGLAQIKLFHIASIRIPKASEDEQIAVALAVLDLLQRNRVLRAKTRTFRRVIESEYAIIKRPTLLDRWWTLGFQDLLKAIGTRLSLPQRAQLSEYFEEAKDEALLLHSQIDNSELKIDRMVNSLFGLSADDVQRIKDRLS